MRESRLLRSKTRFVRGSTESHYSHKENDAMRSRLLLCGCAVLLMVPMILRSAEPPATKIIGKSIDAFSLPDARTGKPVALADFKDRKAVVVLFLGTACPVNNAYMVRLAQLHKDYSDKGVQFLGVNSIRTDSVDDVARHAEKYGIPFPVLKDADQKVANLFEARRTPEAYVLDEKRVVRYRGRIDDQYAIDVSRQLPTNAELVTALDEVLAGRNVTTPETDVAGCLIARARKPKADATISFTKDIVPILQKNCQECHRPGQIGPMPLLKYEDVEGWSSMIHEVVSDRRMPPWYADPKIGKFKNDRRLSDQDRTTLLAWIDQGCPKGDPKDMPAAREFPEGWRIGQPDLVLSMQQEFAVPAEMPRGGVPYKYFVIDPKFDQDVWVERAEARAGATEVVHHIIAFIVPPSESDEPYPPGPPVLPPIIPGSRRATVLCGTAPGDMPTILPAGMARKIPAKSRIVFQMHYTPNGRAQKDRSSIALMFAKKPVERQVLTIPIFPPLEKIKLQIPAGEANYKIEGFGPHNMQTREDGFEDNAIILGFMPHMHVRGKDFYIETILPDGKIQPLLNVPRFNFNWQMVYRYQEPIRLPRGAKIHTIAHYDNSPNNPNNPDPSRTIYWGDQTWQEMMIGWVDFAYDRKP